MTARKRTRKPADVAWGLFYTTYMGKRCLWSSGSRDDVMKAYRDLHPGSTNAPTKPFRITPPAEIRKPGASGRGR